ncbi:MAG TPA: hypothetical protein VMF61_05685, partial [Candidatus Acidoferrales bacterium]|nr:hypothetical protein [Candidatus Acidoferrales bacterium]
MNVKQLLAAGACASLAFLGAPAAYAANPTATITVKWNTQAISTLTVVTDYTVASGVASQGNSIPTYYTTSSPAGGTGSCGGSAVAESAGVANFFNVTPDNTTHYTDCYYKNGADAHVFTTDGLGYALTVAGTIPHSCGAADCAGGPYILCLITVGSWANNVGAANAVASSASSAPALDNGGTNTCAHAGGITMATTGGTGGNILASQANPTGAN